MNEPTNQALQLPIAWNLDEPLTQISFFRDWDYMTSSFGTLKYYWREFGTIPHWDLTMCGGKPVLGNPNNWGFVWPSLFAYMFDPIWAGLVLWGTMTLVGVVAMWALLRRFELDRFACFCGAILFTFNGYFFSHFNQGHIGFCNFHLIPLLILLFDLSLEKVLERKKFRKSFIFVVIASFMLFSAAIPHAIFYAYPAFVLYLVMRFFNLKNSRHPPWQVLRSMLTVLGAHALGFWLAVYKLGPALVWQLKLPRQGVFAEQLSLGQIIDMYLRFVSDYMQTSRIFSEQFWGYWEYNAFIGPFPFIAIGIAILVVIGRWVMGRRSKKPYAIPMGFWLGLLLIGCGLLMILGNDHPLSPARLFRYLPLFNGIRVFSRYHILVLMGLTVLMAYGVSMMDSMFIAPLSTRSRMAWRGLMFALLCGPGLGQSAIMIWNIQGIPYSVLEQKIYPNLVPAIGNPLMIRPWRLQEHMTQTYLLDHNYFSGECYEQLTGTYVNLTAMNAGFTYPMTSAKHFRFADATTNSFSFDFDEDVTDPVTINLYIPPEFKTNIPGKVSETGLLVFEPGKLRGKRLTFDTTMSQDTWSAIISGVGALATAVTLFLI